MLGRIPIDTAFTQSIDKWTEVVKHGKTNIECGFCHNAGHCGTYFTNMADGKCILSIADGSCDKTSSLYSIWKENQTQENAQALLTFITQLYEDYLIACEIMQDDFEN